MSIVRWGRDGSAVYIIGTGDGWECVGCHHSNKDNPDSLVSYDELPKFLAHIRRHRELGECVPDYVEAALADGADGP